MMDKIDESGWLQQRLPLGNQRGGLNPPHATPQRRNERHKTMRLGPGLFIKHIFLILVASLRRRVILALKRT